MFVILLAVVYAAYSSIMTGQPWLRMNPQEGVPASILSFAATLEPELIQHSFRLGVNGLLHRDELDDLIVEAVRKVCKGERYYSPMVRKVNINA